MQQKDRRGNRLTMASTSPKQLLALGNLGFYLLWCVSFLGGTPDDMDAVIKQGDFHGGRSLRSVYTSNTLLDARLTCLTAFYEPFSNALSSEPRLLFIDPNYVLSCTDA
ncbi:hypothetical protein N7G274_004446 [Stereocaulon virgatum]|uniref:Uncharacterized protein n=1 Tax=Stereocaulon virgatum TaxID=373712 RepID=A0ABR4A9Y1_9LECA